MPDLTPWMSYAWTDLGVTATPGPGISARVHKYYADAGHPEIAGDDVAWCAAFVGACLERGGIRSSRSLLARSYLSFGEPLADLRFGAIAVFSRGADPALGHVGFVIGETADDVFILGGNQSNAVSVIPMPHVRLLGIRWPTGISLAPRQPDAATVPEQVPNATFQRALQHVLQMEGGYSDDAYDPGGPTNLGITIADLAGYRGTALTDANFAELKSAIKSLTLAEVAPIYLMRYWKPSCADALPPPLALFHFDTAVNQGVGTAARILQQALAVDIDGEIGPLTVHAATHSDLRSALDRYAEIRADRYRALSTFWRFGKGWLARIDATRKAAAELFTSETSPTSTSKEAPMTDTTTSTNAANPTETKWWGQSLTIWGTIVTTLATVLPVVGPILGIQISADVVHQLGDGVVQILQALAGVIGILMTVYGRSRAIQPLVRREFQVKL